MNLALPFPDPAPDELDALFAKIDVELDALFLEAVSAKLERIPVVETPPAADAA